MNNKDIIKKLQDESGFEAIGDARPQSLNAKNVLNLLPKYKGTFDMENFKSCIRMNEWLKDDFSFEMEQTLTKYLPDYIRDVFFCVKEFKANRRNELTSVQEGFARIMGLPYETQNEKAYVVLQYALQRYYGETEIE